MTLAELYELLGFLATIRNYESIVDNMMETECDRLIKLVNQEINNKVEELKDRQ